jgi:hypothetical protein
MVPEQEFKAALRAFIETGPPSPEVTDLLQRLEMKIASPGDWEAAKHHPLEESSKSEISD